MKSASMILVHGWRAVPTVMNQLESFFRAQGYYNTYKFDYKDTTDDDITSNADRLWSYLEEKKVTNTKIILIGHSMGGLVARKMANDHPNLNVIKLITLATPNYGAKFIDMFPPVEPTPKGLIDMMPGSKFLNELNRTNHTYTEEKVLTYSITNDELVRPSSAIIDNALHLVVDSKARGLTETHSSILEKQEVFNVLFKFINGDIETIDYGPGLRNADCTIWSIKNSTVRWDLPNGAPSTLKAHIRHYINFDVSPATDQVKEHMDKGTVLVRFFDPDSGILTRYSKVIFEDKGLRCNSSIKNHNNILKVWPR